MCFVVSFDLLAHRVKNARYANDHRHPLTLDGFDNLSWYQGLLKEDGAPEKLGHEDAHELTEDVAERQQVEETYRMNEALPFQIPLNLPFQRRQLAMRLR